MNSKVGRGGAMSSRGWRRRYDNLKRVEKERR